MRIIDSLSFLPMSLAKLPKSFGLQELKKGYFPHLFNTRSDVDILRRCCLRFREEFIATNGLDPFSFVTIAAACMGVYIDLHLKGETRAVIPLNGYVRNVNTSEIAAEWLAFMEMKTSEIAAEWLAFMEMKTGKQIQYSERCRGEQKILNYFVDGYEPDGKTVYEFHGCFYHGCDKCFDESSIHPFYNRPMWALKRDTLKKERELRQTG
nr:uncharacterized protein LOC122272597 [Parasteatoda tepidariorum]